MTSPLQNATFDSETACFLHDLRDDFLRQLPLEAQPPSVCRDLRKRQSRAISLSPGSVTPFIFVEKPIHIHTSAIDRDAKQLRKFPLRLAM